MPVAKLHHSVTPLFVSASCPHNERWSAHISEIVFAFTLLNQRANPVRTP
jgi:hypothetical protein